MIHLTIRHGNLDQAQKLYHQLRDINAMPFLDELQKIFMAFLRAGKHQQCVEIYTDIISSGVEVPQSMSSLLLNSLQQVGAHQTAKLLLKHSQQTKPKQQVIKDM